MPMHQTTVRFASDVWATLEEEAARIGVSVAQYIREAAVARLSYGLGRREDRGLEDAIRGAGSTASYAEWGHSEPSPHTRQEVALEHSHDALSSSEALWAQGKLARERASELREQLAAQRRDRLAGEHGEKPARTSSGG